MQLLPGGQQRIVSIDQKGVVELALQTLPQFGEAREIDDEAVLIELMGLKPAGEAAAVAMHEAAVPGVAPLAMGAGETAERLAAGIGRVHGGDEGIPDPPARVPSG